MAGDAEAVAGYVDLAHDENTSILSDSTLDLIRRKNYPAKVAEYSGEMLLVGISYDKGEKRHRCRIEKLP